MTMTNQALNKRYGLNARCEIKKKFGENPIKNSGKWIGSR